MRLCLYPLYVTRYGRALRNAKVVAMTAAATWMKAMRTRRTARGLREVRLIVPDTRAAYVRERVAAQVARGIAYGGFPTLSVMVGRDPTISCDSTHH